MKYKVIDPKGIHVQGKKLDKGATFEAVPSGGDTRAFLHFRQIEAVKEKEKPTDEGPKASAAARALAEENGIDLSTITGSGDGGTITKPDVEAAIEAKKTAQNEPPI